MENYLMSSPRNQQLDYDYQNLDLTLDYYELKDQTDLSEFHNYYDSFSHDNQSYQNDDMYKFQNTKNISLTDNMNLARHHQNLSITSAQDFMPKKVSHSGSVDSIPPLTSSISTQSLASAYRRENQYGEPVTDMNRLQFPSDKTAMNQGQGLQQSPQGMTIHPSPQGIHSMGPPGHQSQSQSQSQPQPQSQPQSQSQSGQTTPNPNSAQYQLQQVHPVQNQHPHPHPPQHQTTQHPSQHPSQPQVLATPRKIVRKKSLSIGSYNISTPMRTTTSPSTASNTLNVAKISKTPYRHSRSLSRTRMDKNGPAGMNPFYNTPNSFVSPKYELSFESEDFQTPMQSSDHHQQFSNAPNFNLQFTSPQLNYKVSPTLRRQNTLDSIKIEDQEDDAFKQIKRAKSFNSLRSTPTESYMSSANSSHSLHHQINEGSHQINEVSHPINHQDIQIPHQIPHQIDTEPSNNIQLLQSQFNNLKSYPASVNLASIANDKASGLLPPMSSFSAPASATTSVSDPSSSAGSIGPAGSGGSATSGSIGSGSIGSNIGASFSAPPSASTSISTASTGSFQQHQRSLSNHSYQPPAHQVSEASLKIAKEINPSFVPDLPIKINEKAADFSDPKKKHACPLCFARFQRPEHVKRHMKSHSSEKPFECDQPNCNKRFNRKDNLKAHLKKIHSLV